MRAIILAAGQGTRLRPLTDNRPKCMVELEGKPLLEHQLKVLRGANIEDIHVVGGYRAEWLQRSDITLHINERFTQTNMVATLFAAETTMDGREDLIIAYGDIVYEPRVLNALLECNAPVCLTVDRAWRRYWEARMDDPLADAETLKLTDGNLVTELGKKPSSYEEIQGQYMGLIKVRADHVSLLPAVWRGMDREATYDGKDYHNMYMTSFLQHLIDSGWETRAALVDNGWLEIDNQRDLDFGNRKSGFYSTRF